MLTHPPEYVYIIDTKAVTTSGGGVHLKSPIFYVFPFLGALLLIWGLFLNGLWQWDT